MSKWIRWFDEISINDVQSVGGKNASLGEMYQNLASRGIRVPNGFAVTAEAYFEFIRENKLDQVIPELLKELDSTSKGKPRVEDLRKYGQKIRDAILSAKIPEVITQEVTEAYRKLSEGWAQGTDVAVRSSATAEDLPDASFAGQQETYLNVRGVSAVLQSCLKCFASLYTDRAISYRHDQGYDRVPIGLSVGVQKMVRSDLAASGVIFSIDTETGFQNAVVINSSYGLGENVVQGSVNPDEFVVFKPLLNGKFRPILQRRLGNKEHKLIYDAQERVKNVAVSPEEQSRFSISDDEVLTLAKWTTEIERYYSNRAGHATPMDIEWAKDGETGKLYVVQARPETVQSQKRRKNPHSIEHYHLKSRGQVLAEGRSVGDKITTGTVRVVNDVQHLGQLQEGDILVTERTDPDWEPAMRKVSAVITNRGGRTCHAAIVCRELGLPAIVGTQTGTTTLKEGEKITVSCAEGETGYVYSGELPFEIERHDVSQWKAPKTKIMLNVGNPAEAFRLSFIPNEGVGLARMEFIISAIQIHPLALLNFDNLSDAKAKAQIEQVTRGYPDKAEYFVDKLAEGVATIAAAFYPHDVIVRMSDFKTNEYANLIGGTAFEPKEENPMIGFRGASRYYDPRYRDGFALECQAMKKVRDEIGLTNVKLMIPFCRTPDEGRKVIAEMEKNGLKQGQRGLEVYVMCEVPSNVILAEEFAEIFDGFSIGSNDLTQLVLGVDRDSELVAHIFDERNRAVKRMIRKVIRTAHLKGKKIGICGQAPSDYPEFARFLVEEGIHSISLNPDAVISTGEQIYHLEQPKERSKQKGRKVPIWQVRSHQDLANSLHQNK